MGAQPPKPRAACEETHTPSTQHIRALFLEPKRTYSLGEAATLLGMDWRELRGWGRGG
jgi:hypothetical protein